MPQDPQSGDQDFQKLSPTDQHAYLMDTDPDYAKLSKSDQSAYLQHVSSIGQPNEGLAPPAGAKIPEDKPLQRNVTSFATQLSNFPHGILQMSPLGWATKEGRERMQQEQEQEQNAMAQPGITPALKQTGSMLNNKLNPAVKNENGVDYGATAANLLPYAAPIAKGMRAIGDLPLGRLAKTGGMMAADLPVGKTIAKAGEFYRSTATENAALPGMARDLKENSIRERFNKMEAKKNPYETGAPPPVSPTPRAAPLWKTNPLTTTDIPSSYNRQPMANPAAPRPAPGAAGTMAESVAPEPVTPGPNLLPEPRATFPGENPNYMASVPRNDLNRMAINRKPGAGTQLQQLGEPILYIPNEAGYPGPRR